MKLMAVIRWVLTLILAVAAGLKLAWLAGRGQVGDSQTLFSQLPLWGKWALIVVELALAAWLANGWHDRWAAFSTICLLSIFLCVVLIEMYKPVPRSCGCLGAISVGGGATSLRITLGLDVAMLLMSLWLYFAAMRRKV